MTDPRELDAALRLMDEKVRREKERKVADAIALERAAGVIKRRGAHDFISYFVIRRWLLNRAWHLRSEAGWQR